MLAACGPFGSSATLAVAVSGGADSLCLAWLARRWSDAVEAVVVDHGLRPESVAEAERARLTLEAVGVPASVLTLDIPAGPDLAARARQARTSAIARRCAARGVVHVLLGHHAGDQAETVAMRLLRGSGPAGLAAMPSVREDRHVRWLRPLLPVPAGRLRATLRAVGLGWADDPSNADPRHLRARLRAWRADPAGDAPSTLRAVEAAAARGRVRAEAERAAAAWLAEHATLHELGFATLHRDDPPPGAFAAVVRAVAGSPYPPASSAVAQWCLNPRAATLGGVEVGRAGRLGPGWLLTREVAAMAAPVTAVAGAVWDGRFRLRHAAPGRSFGASPTGSVEAARRWPARVARTLPALRGPDGAVEGTTVDWVGSAICPACFGAPSLAVC